MTRYAFYFKSQNCTNFDYGIMTEDDFEASEKSSNGDFTVYYGTIDVLKGYIENDFSNTPNGSYLEKVNDALIECIEYAENYL